MNAYYKVILIEYALIFQKPVLISSYKVPYTCCRMYDRVTKFKINYEDQKNRCMKKLDIDAIYTTVSSI